MKPALTWQYVEMWSERQPDAEALVAEERRVTWREFRERVDRTAKAFLEAGVRRGDRVAMLSTPCIEFPVVFMAANKVGAIWLGLSPKYTCEELTRILQDCGPAVLVCANGAGMRDMRHDLRAFQEKVPSLQMILMTEEPVSGTDSFEDCVNRPRPEWDDALASRAAEGDPEDGALLMYTSGSTGKPKGVLHSHRSIVANIEIEARYLDLANHGRMLLLFPINHVAADLEIGFACIYAGKTIVLMDRFDPDASLWMVARERITLLGGVPAMFLLQFASPAFREVDLSCVKTFLCAGAAVPQNVVDTLAELVAKNGGWYGTGYGSTETGGFITYTKPGDGPRAVALTAGRVVPPFELQIVDSYRGAVSEGGIGEIAVRGPMLMKGYWNNPEATAQVVDEDGWYYTGDLAWRDEHGYVHIVGRTSEMFKSGGENVHPREVEAVLEAHEAVLSSAVVGVPDPVYDEVGYAFVVVRPHSYVTPEILKDYCKRHLVNFKVPKHFDIRERLPLLPTGKVDRVSLRQQIVLPAEG